MNRPPITVYAGIVAFAAVGPLAVAFMPLTAACLTIGLVVTGLLCFGDEGNR